MADFWKSNKQKEEFLVKTWLAETFGSKASTKINYAKNQDVINSRSATYKEFTDFIKKKKLNKVSNYEMVLSVEQNAVKIVCFANERIGDSSNFTDNEILEKNYKALKNTPDNVKPIALFAGNVIGCEWTLASFRNFFNAKVEKDGNIENVRMFVGLQKRKQILKKQIKRALDCGAEVVLMKGPQEFDALNNKTFGVGLDIMQEIYEEINNENLHYISEGTSANINFIKKNSNNRHFYNTIKIETNISTKSANPATMSKYAKNYNGKSTADVIIRTNGNFTATEFHDNIIYPSGNLQYQNVQKGKYPEQMVNTGNVFLLVPEASNDVTIVLGSGDKIMKETNFDIENEAQYLKRKKEAIAQVVKEKIDEKIKSDDLIKWGVLWLNKQNATNAKKIWMKISTFAHIVASQFLMWQNKLFLKKAPLKK